MKTNFTFATFSMHSGWWALAVRFYLLKQIVCLKKEIEIIKQGDILRFYGESKDEEMYARLFSLSLRD